MVGRAPKIITGLHELAPSISEKVSAAQFERGHFGPRPEGPTDGNIFSPVLGWTEASGGWKQTRQRSRPRMAALAGLAMLVPTGAALLWLRSPTRVGKAIKAIKTIKAINKARRIAAAALG